MDFPDAESLSKYIASANDMEGANRLSILQQGLTWVGDRVVSVLSDMATSDDDSPNAIAAIETFIQFFADAWSSGNIDLSKDSGQATGPARAVPEAATQPGPASPMVQAARRNKVSYGAGAKGNRDHKPYKDIKHAAHMAGIKI